LLNSRAVFAVTGREIVGTVGSLQLDPATVLAEHGFDLLNFFNFRASKRSVLFRVLIVPEINR
jgi:hypothetical protein